jgi:hypothetical protein
MRTTGDMKDRSIDEIFYCVRLAFRNYTRHVGKLVSWDATITFRWHSSRWTNCRRAEARAETCSLDKRVRRVEAAETKERERGIGAQTGGPKRGVRATCALSRYWNNKWNIRNKSCKTLFSGDNTASSLWTLSRVGIPYCAMSGR